MKRFPTLAVMGCIAAAFSQGCVRTMADVFKDKSEGKGTARTYDLDAAQAWSVAVRVFRWDGAGTIEEHRDQN
jgi:hypothetical protein